MMSPLYRDGDVIDTNSGSVVDISDLEKFKWEYRDELIKEEDKDTLVGKMTKKDRMEYLHKLYDDKCIGKEQLLELVKLKRGSKSFKIEYMDFHTSNNGKGRPVGLGISDYGRFRCLVDIMSYGNILKHKSNGRRIKESDLMSYLDISTHKTLSNLLSRLSKYRLVAKSGAGDKRFVHINPTYANKNVRIDATIYSLFKDDLKEYLSEYEIMYYEMEGASGECYTTLEII